MFVNDWSEILDPTRPESVLIAADWLEERGRPEADLVRLGRLIPFGDGYGDGDGYGYGYGDGDGYGDGHGDGHGDGDGYGDGHGDGHGDGYGYSDGYGYGYGYSYSDSYGYLTNLSAISEDMAMNGLEVGQAYLWMIGHGWMWIGKYVEPCGLFGAVISEPCNLCRTGDYSWSDLARGEGRSQATFVRYEPATPRGTPLPYAVPIARWEGEIPRTTVR